MDVAVLGYLAMVLFASWWLAKLFFCVILFWLWIYMTGQTLRRGKFLWPTSAPRTASSILEMDQLAGFMMTVFLLSIYWRVWRPVMGLMTYLKRLIQPQR
ncbi:hypothetical protein CPB86DRAFT_316764 [Serendipita vermifera]|nr:hypothetical protein CPB86DRAFT_316764 [Serendipita vermifera]